MERKSKKIVNYNSNLLTYRNGAKIEDIPLLKSNKKFITLGLLSGGSILSISIIFTLLIILQSFFLRYVRNNLKPFVDQYDNFEKSINLKTKKLQNLKKINNDIVNSIVDIRSGSAILSEISKLIPKPITLYEISVNNNDLEIKGIVDYFDGLEVLNLYILELDNSEFIISGSTKLIKASTNNQNNDDEKALSFIIKSEIKNEISQINRKYLKEIKSYGLFKRIDDIEKRGLLNE